MFTQPLLLDTQPYSHAHMQSAWQASNADRQELLEEAAVMAQFESPFVVQLVGVITVGNPVYVVLEFMEYGALKSYLEKKEVSMEQKLLWAGDCCEGLAHVHSLGFIHRDVAARNVLVSSEKRCKISDFGLAREMEEDDTCECMCVGVWRDWGKREDSDDTTHTHTQSRSRNTHTHARRLQVAWRAAACAVDGD